MKAPTKKDLLDEIRRLTAENERLTRLAASQRPELKALRAIEVKLRGYIFQWPLEVEELQAAAAALLPGNDDLPSLMELRGICSVGKARVDAALSAEASSPARTETP